MKFDILTLFPQSLDSYLDASIVGRARHDKKISVQAWNIRDYATDKHHITDDTPYGGGAGMVMKVEPIDLALQAVKKNFQSLKTKTIVLSARGKQFTQSLAQEYAALDQLILICGRYEGIDQRVADNLADEEISVGPYVLAGGELAALMVLETVARLIPGVLGNPESLMEESHSSPTSYQLPATTYREYPQYTKPEVYKDWEVPAVLLSGDHAKIKAWRQAQSS